MLDRAVAGFESATALFIGQEKQNNLLVSTMRNVENWVEHEGNVIFYGEDFYDRVSKI